MMNIKKVIFSIIFLFLFFSLCAAAPKEIRILYMNDFHGFAESHEPPGAKKLLGGISFLAATVNKLRGEKPGLLLSAGDMIQGNSWANLTEGQSVIELMNAMEFDAMVLGNHEFDFGLNVLKKRVSEARFPIVCANVEGLDVVKPYVIKGIGDIKIGIIGVVSEDTPQTTNPKNVSSIKFLPVDKVVERYVQLLKERVDVVIVLSHIGFFADRILAQNVKGIHVIVGGHSHTKVEKPVIIGETVIVQAWEHAKALGVLDLTIEKGKVIRYDGHLKMISPEIGIEDKKIKAIVDKYEKIVDAKLGEKIGVVLSDLDGEHVRIKETNFGNLVADVVRDRARADIAIINGGSIRTGIKKGDVKIKDIYSALPFDNYIVAIRMSGQKVKEALEHGVSGIEEETGGFPQVSGVRFTYNPKAQKGSRIKDVFFHGKPLELNREYTVATNDFLAAGGDGYRAFAETLISSKDFSIVGGAIKSEKIVYTNPGQFIRDILVEYIRDKKVITSETQGRIREVSDK